MSKREKYLEKNFAPVVSESFSFSEVCRKIGLTDYCGNRDTVKNYIKKYDLDISHFTFGGGKTRKSHKNNFLSDEEVFCVDSPIRWNSQLKRRIFKNNLLDYKCVGCGNTGEWMGNEISLILDHKNGVSNDNRIENLRFVCPNCNATLPTTGIKNMDAAHKTVVMRKSCTCGKMLPLDYKEKKCITCSKNDLIPPPEELKRLIKEAGSQTKYAESIGLTRRVIFRWIEKYKKSGVW